MRAVALLLLLGCARPAPPLAPAPLPATAPEEAKVWAARAELAAARGDADERDRAIAWIVRLDGQSPWAWLAVGRVRAASGQAAEARDAVTRALALSDDPAIVAGARDVEAALAAPDHGAR